MDPDTDRTDMDMREDSHKWPAPLEEVGEGGVLQSIRRH